MAKTKHAKFKVYQDKSKGWRWRLSAANGETVADSAESYTRRADVERAILDTFAAVLDAMVLNPEKFEVEFRRTP